MFDGLLPLNLFPEGSLAASVITTVWLGVFVISFFNLRYGWVMSGLVVPGYLVPIMLLKPWSAVLIVFEAAITYLIVHFYSERASRTGAWSSLFGRDRFFALVLVSVIVRVSFDGAVVPALDDFLQGLGLGRLELRNELQSFGLVIIALTANQLWKPGLWRGLFTLGVCCAITLLLVRFVLMEFTNFSISNIGYMYEDAAQSILASPKTYIVLLTTAFLASRFNLLYGWDFNGILLPALLALQWYQPSKIVMTFVEAYVILILARYLIGLPWLARMNIEGARKILLLFNISFAYRSVLGWVVPLIDPDLKVSDTFGFGYLLSTLLALKMFDKGTPIHLTRTTLQASASAVIIASLVGFSVKWLGRDPSLEQAPETTAIAPPAPSGVPLDQRLRDDMVMYYQVRARQQMPRPWPGEIEQFAQAVSLLARSSAQDTNALQQAASLLGGIGYRIDVDASSVLYIREQPPARGWGSFLLDRGTSSRLIVEWPRGSDERVRPDYARVLMQLTGARAMALATSPARMNPDGSSDALASSASLFHAFRDAVGSTQILQARLRPPEQVPQAQLWTRRNLPLDLDLSRLRQTFPDLELHWGAPDYANVLRQRVPDGISELLLSRTEMRRVVAQRAGLDAPTTELTTSRRIDGFLASWLFSEPRWFSAQGSDSYRPPGLDELLYLDLEVLSPLLRQAPRLGESGETVEILRQLNRAAATVGYEMTDLRQDTTNERFAILTERPEGARRHWGILVVRLGPAAPTIINVPYPQAESGSAEFGLILFQRLQARAAFFSTAHRNTNPGRQADALTPGEPSLLLLANQLFLKYQRPQATKTLVVRGYFQDEPAQLVDADVVVLPDRYPPGPFAIDLLDQLEKLNLSRELAHRQPLLSTYSLNSNGIARLASIWPQAEFVQLRLSPDVRGAFRRYSLQRVEQAQFAALDIRSQTIALKSFIAEHPRGAAIGPPAALQQALQRFQSQPDVVDLYQLVRQWPEYRFLRLEDPESLQSFITVFRPDDTLQGIWNLNPLNLDAGEVLPRSTLASSQIDQFIRSSSAWLIFADSP